LSVPRVVCGAPAAQGRSFGFRASLSLKFHQAS
jgi:hypothetical protein